MRRLLLLSLFILLPPGAGAQQNIDPPVHFVIIVNSENEIESISQTDLAMVYLGKKTLWAGDTRIVPSMLQERKMSMQRFIEEGLKKTLNQYRAYWKRRLFSGGGTIPRTFRTSEEVIAFVLKEPGGIGVLPFAMPLPEGVKTVNVIATEMP